MLHLLENHKSCYLSIIFTAWPHCLHCTVLYKPRQFRLSVSVCLLHAGTLPRRINVELCGLQSLWGTKNSLDFWHQQLLGGDVPFHLKFALKVTHPPMKSANIDQYLLITSQLQWLKLVTSKLACSRRFPRPIIKSHPEEKVGVALG